MFSLTPFSQSDLLRTVADPALRRGVCVALCDFWLADVKPRPSRAPADRLQDLERRLLEVLNYQLLYSQRRRQAGRVPARREAGSALGLRYEDQTTIVRRSLDMGAIRRKLAGDLNAPGDAATWSMKFTGGGGHAIAGLYWLVSVTPNVHHPAIHIFDPNIGEYVGELADLDPILRDLFDKFPLYRQISEVHRTTEGLQR